MRAGPGALALALLCALPGAISGQMVGPGLEVASHALEPGRLTVGGEGAEVLRVIAPEGIRLSLADEAGSGSPDVERLGTWYARRVPEGDGRVAWTFRAPLTAWTEGVHATPRLRLDWTDGTRGSGSRGLGPLTLAAESPIPGDARVVRPSSPEGPALPVPGWPGLVAVFPALVAVGSGVAWWRGRVAAAIPSLRSDHAPSLSAPTLAGALAGVEEDPVGAIVVAARATRGHPRLRALGIRPSHTNGEVRAVVRERLPAVRALLLLADGVTYAGAEVTPDQVRGVVLPALGELGDG